MRLLTHNQLVCVRAGCLNHYPLELKATKLTATHSASEDGMDEDGDEDEVNLDFILHLLPNLDYNVFYQTATKLGLTGLPEKLPELSTIKKDEEHVELLIRLHQLLLDTHVEEGALVCGKCGRSYPIQQGIPNMRLNEDEFNSFVNMEQFVNKL